MTPTAKKLLFWGALLVLGVYFLGRWAPRENDAELNRLVSGWVSVVKADRVKLSAQQATSDALTKQVAQERARALRNVGEAYTARQAVTRQDSLLRLSLGAADSVVALVGIVETLRTESTHLWEVVAGLQRVADSLDTDRLSWRRLAERAAAVNDSLALALQTVNAARKCRLLGFVPCPSRVTTGLVSMVGGVALGILVHR